MSEVRLGDFIKLKGGGTPSKKVDSYWNGEIPWASVKDFKSEYITTTVDKITEEGVNNSATNVIPAGTLLIATRMAVGKVAFAKIDLAINQDLKAIQCSSNIDKNFLFYLLKSKANYFESIATGATVKGIKLEHILELKIPLPPLAEQKKIAAILDEADQLRRLNQSLLEKYDALSQSLFLDMFGNLTSDQKYPTTLVGEVTQLVKDGPHVSPKYADEGIPILSTRNIRPFQLVKENMKYVSKETFQELTKRFKPQKGDVLITKGGTTGYAKIVDWDWAFCIWVHLAAIRVDTSKIIPKYLESALNSSYGYQQSQIYTRGIANKDLGLKRMIKIKIPFPPLPLQTQFAERLKEIETQKAQAQASLEKSEALFNSLLQRAFKGELV